MPTDKIVHTEPILDQPKIKISNQVFDIWKNLRITMGSLQKTATFGFSVGPLLGDAMERVEMIQPSAVEPDPEELKAKGSSGMLYPGTLVEIAFDRNPMFKGTIDSITISVSGNSESLDIRGQCILAMLRDSQIPGNLKSIGTQQMEAYHKAKAGNRQAAAEKLILDVAKEITESMKVNGATPFSDIEIQDVELSGKDLSTRMLRPMEETAHSYIEKLATQLGYPDVWIDGQGKLIIGDMQKLRDETRQNQQRDGGPPIRLYCFRDPALSVYNNILDTSVTRNIKGVYSTVTCFDTKLGERRRMRVPVSGETTNKGLPLTKRRYIRCKGVGSQKGAQESAKNTLDKAKQTEFSAYGTVAGFGQVINGEKHYFQTNQPVQYVHELAGINWPPKAGQEQLFITNLTYSCSVGSGPQTSVQLSQELPKPSRSTK